MKKILKSIFINSTKQDGTPYIDKNRQPFKMAMAEFQDGSKASMYIGLKYGAKDLAVISQWQPGMEVEITLEQQPNGYFNFKLPTQTDKLAERINTLENFIRLVCHLNGLKTKADSGVDSSYHSLAENAPQGGFEPSTMNITREDIESIPF